MSFIGDILGSAAGGPLLSAGASIIGGVLSSGAAKDAANIQATAATDAGNAQLQSTREVIALQKEQFEQSRTDLAPWREAGGRALSRQERMLGLTAPPVPGSDAFITNAMSGFKTTGSNLLSERTAPAAPEIATTQAAPLRVPTPNFTPFGRETYFAEVQRYNEDLARRIQTGLAARTPAEVAAGKPVTGISVGAIAPTSGQLAAAAQQTPVTVTPEGLVVNEGSVAPQGQAPLTDVETLDLSLEAFKESPGYNFQLSEMERALQNRRAASGTFYSGRHMRELARYTAGLADQEYTDWFNRETSTFGDAYNRLAGISGTGQTAVTNTARLGANAANASSEATLIGAQNFGSTLLSSGASRASGVIASGNIWGDVVRDVGRAGVDWWNS